MFPEKVFVINMDDSTQRWNKIHTNLSEYSVIHERFPGINGRTLSSGTKKEYFSPLCRNLTCSPAMMGCALSHFKIWEKMVKENIDSCIVLEDDAVWTPSTWDKIKQLSQFKRSLIKLHTFIDLPSNQDKPIRVFHAPSLAGYLLYKETAQQLIQAMKPISYHIDLQMSDHLKQIETYYFPCIQTDGYADSSINQPGSRKEIAMLPEKVRWTLTSPVLYPFGIKVDILFLIGIGVCLVIIGLLMFQKKGLLPSINLDFLYSTL
jgi:GR25 family glycosyltransferase involved in LPS biosynthesis